MKNITALLILTLICVSLQGQIAIRQQVSTPYAPDSIDLAYYSKKRPFLAGKQILGMNVGLWAFDRYVLDAPYAYINIHTIKANLKKGFVWDNDQMGNNMFLHPYHGSLYYNAARSNGYSYWQSGAFALGGSAIWELFLENEYPSINDIVATPIGGMTLGEVFYRSSDLILDDTRTGSNRFFRELSAFAVSPMRGLTRIITGDAWRKRPTTGRQFGVPDISVEVATGVRAVELKDGIFDKGLNLATDIYIEYGDRYETDNEKPFDHFTLKANMNIVGSQPLLSQLNIIGKLHATDLIETEKDFLSIGLYQHFDYYDSDTISSASGRVPYRFCSPASFGVGFIYDSNRSKNWDFNAYAHFNAVILGGTLSDHYLVDKRDYNLASGISWKTGFNLSYKDKFSVSTSYEAYRMFTWKGYPEGMTLEDVNVHDFNYQGDHSQAVLHAISLKADLKLRKNIYLTGIGSSYTRDTNYKYYEDVFSQTTEGRLMLTYKF